MARDEEYEPSIESFELYHKYHSPRRQEGDQDWKTAALKGPALPALGQAITGSAGAAVSTVATYPLGLVVARLQTQRQMRRQLREREKKGKQKEEPGHKDDVDDSEYTGLLDAACKIYRSGGGLSGLYAGVGQATAKAVVDSFVFFLAYTFLRQRRLRARNLKAHALLPVLDELSVGYLAETFTKFFTTPISTILTRKQVEGLMSENGKSSSSTRDLLSQVIMDKGVKGLWSGYSASLFLAFNPSITFLLNEVFKLTLLPRSKRRDSPPSATFLLAAMSKAIATSITYPFTLAKTRAQAASSQPGGQSDPTILHTVLGTARSEGVTALYDGLTGDVLRGFLGHGITMLVKDAVNTAVIRLYYLLLKGLKRYPSPEELVEQARLRAEELAESAREQAGVAADKATEKSREVVESVAEGGAKAAQQASGDVSDALKKMRKEKEWYSDETAEMVADYVEDVADGWKGMYHWFWDREKRGPGQN